MPYNPLIISDYILYNRQKTTPLQSIKLTYISHGFNLAINDKPLVDEDIEAWQYGPVIPSLYHILKKYGSKPIQRLSYCGTLLTDVRERRKFIEQTIDAESRDVIDQVLNMYGGFSGMELVNLTHKPDTPWRKYYKQGVPNIKIPNSAIKKHYNTLVRYE